MNAKITSRRSFLGTLTVLVALAVAPFGIAAGPAPTKSQSRFEVRFLEEMIDHHYAAVKMSELCAGRTIHPELQELCDQIKSAQTAEIAQMQSWLQDWYGITHEPEIDRKTQRQLDQLAAMTGEEFEIAYMTMMIEHHSMAVMMALDCLQEAYHAEMLNMCAKMLGDQGNEIALMRIWLEQWYGITDLSGKKSK